MDTNDQYFDCLCRTCMIELGETASHDGHIKQPQQGISIFNRIEEFEALRISELLYQSVPQIDVDLSDELPKKICCKCLQQLLNVFQFQQMCLQSEKKMRQQLSIKETDVSIPAAAVEDEILTNDSDAYHWPSFQSGSPHQNFEQSSIQDPLEATEELVKPDAIQINYHLEITDHLLEHSNDSQGNFSESIKNEPIEDVEALMEYSDDDTIQSAMFVKDETLSTETEEQQQIYETNVTEHRKFYECPYCWRRFYSKTNMVRHKANHEGADAQHMCEICGKIIVKKNFIKHKLTHSDGKVHKCDFCDKSFYHFHTLRRHMCQHIGENPYKCNYCERELTNHVDHKKHMRVHFGDKIHRCHFCPLGFNAVTKLRFHLAKHRDEDSETRERNMQALKELEAELRLKLSDNETEQPSIEQSQEQFVLKAKENVKNLHITNGEDKPFECPYCPRRFNTVQNMYKHKIYHEGVKRVTCDICGKSIMKQHIKTHKLTHSDVRPHKCDFCEKRFTLSTDLRTHTRLHTGEKPCKCNYCECAFSTNNALRKHLKFHLGENIFRCELCPLAFPAAKELRVHFPTHKNEDSETRERNLKALQEAEAKIRQKMYKQKVQQPSKEQWQQQFEMQATKVKVNLHST